MVIQRYEFPSKLIGLPIVLLGLAICVAPVSAMQIDMFLKFPEIRGESTDAVHEDWIVIGSLGMGVARTQDTGSGSSREQGRFLAEDISWTQKMDASTPKLFEAVANGTIFPDVQSDFQTRDGHRPLIFLEIDLKNVGVSELLLAGDTESGVGITGALNYGEIIVKYTMFDRDGNMDGNFEARWNLNDIGGASSVAGLIGLGLNGAPVVVPLPGAVWLLGSALLALAGPGLRRRRGC